MKHNYHTHTKRCHHASGEDREYVEAAIQSGLKTLGFSDHSPYLFKNPNYRSFRMEPNEFEDYVNSVLSLKKEYKNEIDIKLGVELEYYEDKFEKTLDFIDQFPLEYKILSQHYIKSEPQGYYAGLAEGDELLTAYVDECITAMETGLFLYLAHPDLIGYSYSPKVLNSEYFRLCKRAKELNMPLEVNLLGLNGNRHYPKRKFFEIAAEAGANVVIGADAHSPSALINLGVEKAHNLIKGLNLNVIEKFDI